MSKIYEQGTIKVVWIKDPSDKIYSRMFEQTEGALKYAQQLETDNYLIFELDSQKEMEQFCWNLLPFGKYKLYKTIINLLNNKSVPLKNMLNQIV